MRTAFYCVADADYHLGAVAMIDSLRLIGHDEPAFVLDCGLEPRQRRLLEAEATVVDGPRDRAPHVLKAIAPRLHPADVMVLIDTDMIVTRSLEPLVEAARPGAVVGGDAELDRFCPEWEELLGLGPVRPRPYLSTGLIVAGGEIGAELVRLVDERRGLVDFDRTFWRANDTAYPLLHADQDLINGVLAAIAGEDQVIAFDPRLSASPPFAGLRAADGGLDCSYADGTVPYVVHHWLAKPWLVPTRDGVYSQLMRRAISDPAAPLQPDRVDVPLRLRTGARASLAQAGVNLRERIRARLGGRE